MNNIDYTLNRIYEQHDAVCNQTYGGELPYSFHLKAVVAQALRYKKLLRIQGINKTGGLEAMIYWTDEMIANVTIAAAGHDLIEDARLTYNDVVKLTGSDAAEIIYNCTEEKGRNREGRHSDKFFDEISLNRHAVFVKLCDIMANVLFSQLTNSSMYHKYRQEFPHLKEKLYIAEEYDPIWIDLENLLNIG